MLKLKFLDRFNQPVLQHHLWPPVKEYTAVNEELNHFISSSTSEKKNFLRILKQKGDDQYPIFLNKALGFIYGYVFGYEDSPCYVKAIDELEIQLYHSKIILERELLDYWLVPQPIPHGLNQFEAVEYLQKYIVDNTTNTGVFHEFFDFLQDHASREALMEFLLIEVTRNEVVDDEVAFLVAGLQGAMKMVTASNLWDECGNGKLQRAHTYWLRRLLNFTNNFEQIKSYRESTMPWFTKIMSNSSNMQFTRAPYKFRGYGSFLITESWVLPHFKRIINGLKRTGLYDRDISIYFDAHCKIDPYHTAEMLEGILQQQPELQPVEVDEVLYGAHIAVAAGTKMYEYLLPYLRGI